MRILIATENDNEEDETIELSDEDLNNDNYVTMTVDKVDLHITLDDIYCAVLAFKEKRMVRLKCDRFRP